MLSMSISLFRDIDLVPTPAVSSDVQRHWRYDFVKSRQVLESILLFSSIFTPHLASRSSRDILFTCSRGKRGTHLNQNMHHLLCAGFLLYLRCITATSKSWQLLISGRFGRSKKRSSHDPRWRRSVLRRSGRPPPIRTSSADPDHRTAAQSSAAVVATTVFGE